MSEPVQESDPPLPDLLGERYRTGRVLGRGGMARVYLARDLKHGRDVAIKVIRPELSASLGHERFLREIEIAARLRHPNIVPLYDSGEVAGSLYFVMPYEEGPSLRERLQADGPLPLTDALSVLRDVARALAYAHEHGVVHRDVKSDNVMLSGGAAVVTDFGIAKAVSAALTDPAGTTLTQTGSAIGTPAYMSPEQATGDPATDHRTDLYAFGCLAYEVFTGNPPFHALSRHQVVAAHITTVPPLVTTLRMDVPPAVAELIARCLEKDPDTRPQSARDLLGALDRMASAVTVAAPPPPTTGRPRPAQAASWVVLALAVSLLGAAVYLANRGSGGSAPITLAVLPFGNTNSDSTLTYVAEGVAEHVASALTRVPGILIKSRSGARVYRGQLGVDVTEAGIRLKADYLLVGIVRQDRGSWILSAELARAADAASLWTANFNVSPDEQAGAAERIAESLVSAMRAEFPGSIGSAPVLASNQRTSNAEAYRLWLQGQEKLNRRGQSVQASADLFRQAIQLDPQYAQAYSGLSMALALFPYFQGVPAREVKDSLVSAARRALELDSTLAQPHVALGMAHAHEYQWDSATAELETAVRLDPRDVESRVQVARHLNNQGYPAPALRHLRAARDVDPASSLVLGHMSYAYYLNGQMDSALAESRRALETDSTNFSSLGLGAMVRLGANRPREARALIDQLSLMHSWYRGFILARSGDPEAARKWLRDLDAASPQPWLAETKRALTYLGLGDTANALSALERATDSGEMWPFTLQRGDPAYNSISGSARFRVLLGRVGLRR